MAYSQLCLICIHRNDNESQLFFVTVGSTVDLNMVIDMWPVVLFMSIALMVGKVGVVAVLSGLVGLSLEEGIVAGASLSQGGEFAFVILGQAAAGNMILPPDLDKILVAVVILSMGLTSFAVDATIELLNPAVECEDEECIAGRDFEEERKGSISITSLPSESVEVAQVTTVNQLINKEDDE